MTSVVGVSYKLVPHLYFDLYHTELCFSGSSWEHIIVGSDNVLASNRCQAITWTNDQVHWHYASQEAPFTDMDFL